VRRSLVALVPVVLVAGGAALAADAPIVNLQRPAFPRAAATKPAPPDAPRLVLVSSRRNKITDVVAWFRRNGLTLREWDVPGGGFSLGPKLPPFPEAFSTSLGGLQVVRAIRQKNVALLVYGRDFSDARVLVASDPTETASPRIRYGLDFTSYGSPPPARPGEQGFFQEIRWAAEVGGILYVANAHRTYASFSRGLNAYLTAVDTRRRKVLWRSGSLLANAATFDVVGHYIVAGYGFTAEPDFLYLIDRRDGKVVQRLPLPSAPDYIIRKGRQVFVRTYDHDVVVEVRSR